MLLKISLTLAAGSTWNCGSWGVLIICLLFSLDCLWDGCNANTCAVVDSTLTSDFGGGSILNLSEFLFLNCLYAWCDSATCCAGDTWMSGSWEKLTIILLGFSLLGCKVRWYLETGPAAGLTFTPRSEDWQTMNLSWLFWTVYSKIPPDEALYAQMH